MTTDDPTGLRHQTTVSGDYPPAVFIPGAGSLMLYDPASTTGDAWLHCDTPVDLREWA